MKNIHLKQTSKNVSVLVSRSLTGCMIDKTLKCNNYGLWQHIVIVLCNLGHGNYTHQTDILRMLICDYAISAIVLLCQGVLDTMSKCPIK